jgi:hypothetical protein
MWELFLFGSLGFWLLSSLGFILMLGFIVMDRPARASGVLFTYLALSYFFGHASSWSIVTYTLANPLGACLWILGYFAAGIVWGFIKWYFFLLDQRDRGATEPPQVQHYRRKILAWMGYWPLSLLWSMLGDVLTRAWKFILRRLTGIMQSMSNRMFPEGAKALQDEVEEQKSRLRRSRA